jgi:predicted O-linked N-acetylglucosamine transferase (SPINDLY family)
MKGYHNAQDGVAGQGELMGRSSPADAAARLTRRGHACHCRGELAEAMIEYNRALAVDQDWFDAWFCLGCANHSLGAYAEAARCLRRAAALRPLDALARLELARALFNLGDADAALENFRLAAADEGLRSKALRSSAVIVPGCPGADNATILKTRRDWAMHAMAGIAPAAHRYARHGGRLRVGYVSAFFGAQNWMKPVWGIINHHDRARFDIHLFCDREPPSATSGYHAHGQDQVHRVDALSNDALVIEIGRLGIDILVDLNGYSFQKRLGVFMRRPAPVIIGALNMYATSGIAAFDYIIGDAAVIPDQEEQFYTERVRRVPGSYLAFSVPYPVPDVAAPPCLTTGAVTFGSFSSQYKITGGVIAAWSTILRQAPESRLLVRNRALGDPSNRTALRERFHGHGISPDRLLLDGPAEHFAFLAAYDDVDIALDTFPYSGGTTTTEALWQGVPVLSFNGDRWASRTSRSLLLAAGLSEWCRPDRADYIAQAVVLARSPATPTMLARLRETMRARLLASPVCDTAGLCRAMEALYEQVAK